MRWRQVFNAQPASDLLEAACLLILCAAMTFSVLNIGVHRLAEPLWKPINHGLSPDGKEYVSISIAGMRVHDVQSGRETQRVTWRWPWSEQDWPISGSANVYEYLFADRDGGVEYRESNGRANEAKVTIEISNSKRFAVGNFPGGCTVWWDRFAKRTSVANFPEHLLLRCYVDEANDRYWLECIRYPATKIARKTASRIMELQTEALLSRKTDVWEMRLRDNTRVALYSDLSLGSPIAGDFRTRLVADSNGQNVRVIHWDEFLEPDASEVPYSAHWFLGNLDDCQIYMQGETVVIDQETNRLLIHPRQQQELGALVRRPTPKEINFRDELSTPGAQVGYFDDRVIGIRQSDQPDQYRFQCISYSDRIRDTRCRDAQSHEILRAADENGQVWDTPITKEGVVSSRLLALAPYPWIFPKSLALFGLAAAIWIASAAAHQSLIKSHGWFVLFCCAAWPLFCWGAEQACDAGSIAFGVRAMVLSAGALFCGLAAVLIVSHEKPLRPCAMCLVVAISTYYLWSLGSHSFGGSYF